MLERICPTCQTGNNPDATTCTECGTIFEQPLARRSEGRLAQRGAQLPARWQQAGKAVALGAVALAVEVGAAWLQQRNASKGTALVPTESQRAITPKRSGFVARQRVWETYEGDRLTQRVIEQTVWNLND